MPDLEEELCEEKEKDGYMKDLPIQRCLDENTRNATLRAGDDVYAVHFTEHDEIIFTADSDYSRIYAVLSAEFYRNSFIKMLPVFVEN